jgi:uncharacterized membrane protein HdeD (DUF308 family)
MARTLSHDEAHAAARDDHPSAGWGWFVALGAIFLVLSVLAIGNLLAATVASVLLVGILMLIGGVAQLVEAFQVRRWGSLFLLLLSGVLYTVAGMLAFMNPTLAAAALTLFLAIALVVSGALRTWWGFTLRAVPGRGWIVASGIVSIIAGIVFYAMWPQNALWLPGLVLAVDLGLQGMLLTAFGLALKRMRP